MRPLQAQLRRWIILFSVLGLWSSDALAQGDTGFLRGQGKVDIALSFNRDTYRDFWVSRQRREMSAVGRVTRDSYTIFTAVGILDDLDFQASASYTGSTTSAHPLEKSAAGYSREDDFQDLTAGFKFRPLSFEAGPGEASVLFAPAVKLPLASYEDDGVTAIGDGQSDYRARIIAHYGFNNGIFVSVESGYDIRDGRPKDEIPLNITAGVTVAELVTIMPFYQNVNSLGGYNIGEGSFPGIEEDYERLGLATFIRITENFGLSASWRTTVRGVLVRSKNTGDVEGFSVGLVLRF
ncbi:MAG: hypothetical protein RL885_31500 [Planctomycetota bacterium]